jgi:predicted nucleic acid-binding protein
MTFGYARASFFDASALVKVYVEEPRSEVLRTYFNAEATKFTTTFCFYETLNILKAKWKHGGKLTKEQYLEASFRLTAWHAFNLRYITNPELTEPVTLCAAKDLAACTGLDMSDALQLITVRDGYFSSLAEGSRTVFVTADKELATQAGQLGLRVWYVMNEDPPAR